jgi:hypothetical protein
MNKFLRQEFFEKSLPSLPRIPYKPRHTRIGLNECRRDQLTSETQYKSMLSSHSASDLLNFIRTIWTVADGRRNAGAVSKGSCIFPYAQRRGRSTTGPADTTIRNLYSLNDASLTTQLAEARRGISIKKAGSL